ncbi:SET and MYND domain-containing protein 4 [Drosophila eugracilis]|uniref:SET and MYND domain-containing protein 4 n=1 Tax=Drosophila eugracilis TaxID=29029 RepID=UPI0007E6BDF1|nr:SET and MYND domain-containing protein 4 [Drosophila eugracilis]
MDRLANVFSQQDKFISLDGGYKDEYETFKSLYSLPAVKLQAFQQLTVKLLQHFEKPHDKKKCAIKSRKFREEGNFVFRSSRSGSSQDSEGMLEACKLYTEAVFKAEDAVDELALAFANRGMALQEYGYYKESYDDCANALECGYPEKLRHKVIMRQAHCAWKLENIGFLEEHLFCLEKMQLNETFKLQLDDLQNKLQNLKNQSKEVLPQGGAHEQDIQEIVTDPEQRGRYMVAKEAITKGKIILSERASCFVPLEQRLICQQCAASLMCAPIPCSKCHKRVVYCSRKCREAHSAIHRYECAAYRKNILKLLGVSHLALRMVLVYIPHMLPQLQKSTSAQEIWEGILNLAKISESPETVTVPEYLQSLRMVSHLDQASQSELVYHTLSANLLQVYLTEHTDFFEQFRSSSASIKDWQVITSALILRSAGQLLSNGHVGNALVPFVFEPNDFALLQPDMWQKPRHLKLGQLHNMGHLELITAINLPYLSLCNHSCDPSIRTKFDGNSVVNYAAKNILAGEEIYNCYTRDYKNSLKVQRSVPLKEVYKFQCSCVKCTQSNPDQDYLNFHRYRCEKPNCRQEFLPNDKLQQNNLSWWLTSNSDNSIICTVCKKQQQYPWFNGFLNLIEGDSESKISELLKAFDDLDKW